MWELDYKESWVPKSWCFWTVVLEKTLESPLDYKEIQPVHPKGNKSWIFIERTDAEAETPLLWPPDVKTWLLGKKAWCWERLKAEGEWDDRRWDGWMASPTQWAWVWELVKDREAWHGALHGEAKSRTQLSDWTELDWCRRIINSSIESLYWRTVLIYIYNSLPFNLDLKISAH